MAEATLAFAPELVFFLRPGRRSGLVPVRCDVVSTLGHVVESLGVPLTEVGTLTVNGRLTGPSWRLAAGEIARVAPGLRPQRMPTPRFLLDVHLGTVARRLRLVGVDAAYHRNADDLALVRQANDERRVLLTRDRGLLMRRALRRGAFVRGSRPDEQFADVLDRFKPLLAPWTRCGVCNGLLAPVGKADIERQLLPGTRRSYDSFAQCRSCGRVYWRGAHSPQLAEVIGEAARIVAADVAGPSTSGVGPGARDY